MIQQCYFAEAQRPRLFQQPVYRGFGLDVPYPALIAFFGESCRIVVRLHDVCYTDKSAKAAREFNLDLAPRASHPAPRTPLKEKQ